MTPSLRELQQGFAADVLGDTDTVLVHVQDGVFAAARHFQIYRNNTFANLTDALAACYPVIQRLVGEGFFGFLADGYIRHHPPRSGNLHDFGAALAEFIATFEPARSLPYLPDVARLEWAWQRSYHAQDAASLAPERLASVPAQDYARIVLRLHPSAVLLESAFPCRRIWQVNQLEYRGEPTVDLDTGPEQLLILRRGLDVVILTLDPGEYALLRSLDAGLNLGDASAAAFAAAPEFDLGAVLHRHIGSGTFSDFTLSPEK
jgi:hypothetical protein